MSDHGEETTKSSDDDDRKVSTNVHENIAQPSRKRSRPSNTSSMDRLQQEQWMVEFTHQRHSLRVSASNVAAMTGYHPYKVLPELVMSLVYQGTVGNLLLRHDASQLGLSMVTPEQALLDLARKAGAQSAVQQALEVQQGTREVRDVQAAQQIKERVVQEAKKKGKLTQKQLLLLQEGVRSAVDTGYGTANEEDALNQYEAQCGWPVTERNSEVRAWPFQATYEVPAENAELTTSATPIRPASAFHRSDTQPPVVVDLTSTAVANEVATQKAATEPNDEIKPYFIILGSVDGIREELVPVQGTKREDDDDSWVLQKVIVECKHRMKHIRKVPPLYEQIQTCIYCQMYNVTEADIIQVLRQGPSAKSGTRTEKIDSDGDPKGCVDAKKSNPEWTKQRLDTPSPVTIHYTRFSLNDPISQHRTNWVRMVLPRLRSFVDAVYTIRSDPTKRFRLLLSSADVEGGMKDAWELLLTLCPWLRHGDIAYRC